MYKSDKLEILKALIEKRDVFFFFLVTIVIDLTVEMEFKTTKINKCLYI